jgi:hypothetical protein
MCHLSGGFSSGNFILFIQLWAGAVCYDYNGGMF